MKKKLKLKTNSIIFSILVLVFLFAISKIIIFAVDLNTNKNDNKKLIDEVIEEKLPEEILGKDTEKINFNKLLSINADTVGWIKFNQDKVNNPIVHTNDNSYYLNHSFYKKKNQAGTIFMDHRNHSFNDKNVVLFGHSMIDDTMFGSLQDVFKKDFFNNENDSNIIQLINKNNEVLNYQIFSYYIIEKEEYYITTSFKNKSEFKKFIKTIKKRSYKAFDIDVNENDNLLTLSTCSGTAGTSKRMVIHATRTKSLN